MHKVSSISYCINSSCYPSNCSTSQCANTEIAEALCIELAAMGCPVHCATDYSTKDQMQKLSIRICILQRVVQAIAISVEVLAVVGLLHVVLSPRCYESVAKRRAVGREETAQQRVVFGQHLKVSDGQQGDVGAVLGDTLVIAAAEHGAPRRAVFSLTLSSSGSCRGRSRRWSDTCPDLSYRFC